MSKLRNVVVRSRRKHLTDSVIMIRPTHFNFNPETAKDNEFQRTPAENEDVIKNVLGEFDRAVEKLRGEGVRVDVLDDPTQEAHKVDRSPDEVFPNNWIQTFPSGEIFAFPMKSEIRRREPLRLNQLWEQLEENFVINSVTSMSHHKNRFLEGTGSLVIDHGNSTVYAALSQRTDRHLLDHYMQITGYEHLVDFETESSTGLPFYHTNVMMSVGEDFAVVCFDSIKDPSKKQALQDRLLDKFIIDVSLKQTEESFCGNILQLHDQNGDGVIALSQRAFDGFTLRERKLLEQHGGRLIPLEINTIEEIGGGSARCMLAENFLPKKDQL